jgi:hypothetical protein
VKTRRRNPDAAATLLVVVFVLLAFVLGIAVGRAAADPLTSPRVPNAQLTPGVALATVTAAAVCRPGYAGETRSVTEAVKRRVYRAYGVTPSTHRAVSERTGKSYIASDYEVDHLISLELGGSNDSRNLWPQSYLGPWNAHDKDALENTLHVMVCAGRLSLADAQHAIATDWPGSYRRYVDARGPLSARDVHTDKVF